MNGLRAIKSALRAQQGGGITRLISPHDLGEQLKPFIFLDYLQADIQPGFGFPMHPHSGIATLTWQPGCDVQYQDTTGQKGVLKAGGLEWMNAAGGAWHQGLLMGQGLVSGFQLWVAMPPVVEDGPAFGQYIAPEQVPSIVWDGGCLKVFLGQFEVAGQHATHMAQSPILSHQYMNYAALSLSEGATWHYTPPADHDVAWVFIYQGSVLVGDHHSENELLVLGESGSIALTNTAQGESNILLGTAKKHQHPLLSRGGSVHTNLSSLQQSQDRIRQIRRSAASTS
jgi:redox-sensitive bicupin YhaK (pirin superfamily)